MTHGAAQLAQILKELRCIRGEKIAAMRELGKRHKAARGDDPGADPGAFIQLFATQSAEMTALADHYERRCVNIAEKAGLEIPDATKTQSVDTVLIERIETSLSTQNILNARRKARATPRLR